MGDINPTAHGQSFTPRQTSLVDAFAEHKRVLTAIMQTNPLRNAVIDDGDLTIRGGTLHIQNRGNIVVSGGGDIQVLDDGTILVQNGGMRVEQGGVIRSGNFDGNLSTGDPGSQGWALGSARLALLGAMVVPVDWNSGWDYQSGFSIGTTVRATKATVTMPVPSWADEAAVQVTTMFMCQNQSGSTDKINFSNEIDGVTGGGQTHTVDPGEVEHGTVPQSEIINVSGRTSFDIEGQMWTNANTWPSDSTNAVLLTTIAMFRKAP